jgi:hypothetical protein
MKNGRDSLKLLETFKVKDPTGFMEIRQRADGIQNMPTHGTGKKFLGSPPSLPSRNWNSFKENLRRNPALLH